MKKQTTKPTSALNVKVSAADLRSAIGKLALVPGANNTNAGISVSIKSSGDELRLVRATGDGFADIVIPCEGEDSAWVELVFGRLKSAITALREETISIEHSGDNVAFAGGGVVRLQQWTEWSSITQRNLATEAKTAFIDGSELEAALRIGCDVAGKKDTRAWVNAVHLIASKKKTRVVATDGRLLFSRVIDADIESCAIPAKSAEFILAVCGECDSISTQNGRVEVSGMGSYFSAQCIENGAVENALGVLDRKDAGDKFSVDIESLTSALKSTISLSEEYLKACNVSVGEDQVIISTEELGHHSATFCAKGGGKSTKFKASAQLLLKFAGIFEGETEINRTELGIRSEQGCSVAVLALMRGE